MRTIVVGRSVALVLAGAVAAGCGTEPAGGGGGSGTDVPYAKVPPEQQRVGDPTKGYDYLINGGYITCGLPLSIAPRGAAEDRLLGRTGDNALLPYYWSAATAAEGVRVVGANCLFCHAGRINGQLVIGLGAAERDFTASQLPLVEAALALVDDANELAAMQRFRDRIAAIADWSRPLTIGANPADSLTAALFAHRDPATLKWSNEPLIELPPPTVVPVDVPPWWRMRKKTAMFYNASGRGDHARLMMAASLLCTESVDEARAIDEAFVDVRAWIESSVEAPRWPFAIDMNLATRGEAVFEATCARCHGTYGDGGVYANLLVPLADVGTDPVLVTGEAQFADRFVDWLAASFWGETSRLEPALGYVAPPLDGIWATAPYLHNGSVPTLDALLESRQRPRFWTRTFESADYDPDAVGWRFTKLARGHADEPTLGARIKIFDTTQPGYSNQGHTFGDDLATTERRALLEYLKTL